MPQIFHHLFIAPCLQINLAAKKCLLSPPLSRSAPPAMRRQPKRLPFLT
jgi:hypothetical protein